MSNAILKTESRSLRLLLVVLMASVGLSLLVGCGKKQGQVVGGDKTPSCVGEDCKGDDKPFSGTRWEDGVGYINFHGNQYCYWDLWLGSRCVSEVPMEMTLGLVFRVQGSSQAGAHSIDIDPVGKDVRASGSLFVNRLTLDCGYGFNHSKKNVPAGEYEVVKNLKAGKVTQDSFGWHLGVFGNQMQLRSGNTALTLELGEMYILPNSQYRLEDPAGYTYDNFLFGKVRVSDSQGCFKDATFSTGTYGSYY